MAIRKIHTRTRMKPKTRKKKTPLQRIGKLLEKLETLPEKENEIVEQINEIIEEENDD